MSGAERRPSVAALMIGRGGSSFKDKNILPVLGVPLLLWSASAARRSRHVTRFYCSSDCPRILETALAARFVGAAGGTAAVNVVAVAGPA